MSFGTQNRGIETTFLQGCIHLSVLHEGRQVDGFSGHRHQHPFDEIGVVLEGECTWRFRRGETVVLRAGEAVLVPSGASHRESAKGPVRLGWLGFSSSLAASALPPRRRLRLRDDAGEVERLLHGIYREVARRRSISERLNQLALEQVLLLLSARDVRGPRPASDPANVPAHRLLMVRSIAAHFDQNPGRPVPLDEIARYHRITPRHLSLLFRRVFGVRPTDYRQRRRIEYAMHLLRDGSTEIKEIASACGFSDAAHFSKAFRAFFGKSPTHWRSQN